MVLPVEHCCWKGRYFSRCAYSRHVDEFLCVIMMRPSRRLGGIY